MMQRDKKIDRIRGVSLAEFLLCTPILIMLSYMAFDLNKRFEKRQLTMIMARNAVSYPATALPEIKVTDFAKVHEPAEASTREYRMHHGENAPSWTPWRLEWKENSSIADVLLKQPNGLRPTSETFSTIGTGIEYLANAGTTIWNPVEEVASAVVGFPRHYPRLATVNFTDSAESNVMLSGLGLIASQFDTDMHQTFVNQRNYRSRFYLRPETAFQSNHYTGGFLVSFLLGLPKSHLGTGDDRNEYLQSRCMMRFSSNSRCKNQNTLMLDFGTFSAHVYAIGAAKLVFQYVATALSFGSAEVVNAGVKEGFELGVGMVEEDLKKVIEGGIEKFVDKAINKVSEKVTEKIQGELKNKVPPAFLNGGYLPSLHEKFDSTSFDLTEAIKDK